MQQAKQKHRAKLKYDHGGINDPAKQEKYTYFANGLMKTKLDRNGKTTNFEYYAQGWLKSQTVGNESISYTYDGNGNQLTVTDATGTTTRQYDAFNRVYSKAQPNIGTFSYQYDITTGVTGGYYAELTTDAKGNTTKKVFDKMGRLYQVFDGNASTPTQYEYYDNGALKCVTYANGAKEEYTYYATGNLEKLINKLPNGIVTDSYSYTYDKAGNQLTKTETIAGVNKGTTIYTYDDLNRLKTVTEPNGKTTVYQYDKAGNRKVETVTENGVSVQTDYHYNEQNRLIDTVTVSGNNTETYRYYYDNNGNMLSKTKETLTPATGEASAIGLSVLGETAINQDVNKYEYNGFNKITVAYTGGVKSVYAYNGEGLRVSKTVSGETTYFGYEYDKVVIELDGSGNQTARNLYGTNLISRTVGNQKLYYQFNGHADVTALTDVSGVVVASYYYDAFGVELSSTGDIDNPFRYAGYEFDDETGLYYLKSRFYDASTARFLQKGMYRVTTSHLY